MSRKGVLISSPDVKAMTPAQWAFEFHALHQREETQVKIMKNLIVNILGLNALKPKDGNNNPKDWDTMTNDERESFLPLIAWCSRPDMLKLVIDQNKIDIDTAAATNVSKSYDELISKMEQAVDDGVGMDPIVGMEITAPPKDPRIEQHKKQFNVMQKDFSMEVNVDGV